MPPFVSTECPFCKRKNRIDLAGIKNKLAVVYRGDEDKQEYSVTCEHCGHKFKIAVKEDDHGKEE